MDVIFCVWLFAVSEFAATSLRQLFAAFSATTTLSLRNTTTTKLSLELFVIWLLATDLTGYSSSFTGWTRTRSCSLRMDSSDHVQLRRDGRHLDMLASQITAANVALAFRLDERSVWLRGVDNQCYFPIDDHFTFAGPVITLHVEGTAKDSMPTAISLGTELPGPSTPSTPSTIPCYSGSRGKFFSVKVIKATKKGSLNKPEFNPIEVGYVEISPDTANILHINKHVQAKWGEGYAVVSNDGLPIVDSPGNRGMKFWKVGSRKLFAIKDKGKGKKRMRLEESDEEGTTSDSMADMLLNIDKNISKILDVSSRINFPIGFTALLTETFLCKICQSIITPPAIFARCCKTIIGCQTCVDRWYRGETGLEKKCPLCRGDRGFADTSKISGLDEFLSATDKLLNTYRFVPSPPRSPSLGALSD